MNPYVLIYIKHVIKVNPKSHFLIWYIINQNKMLKRMQGFERQV